MKYWINKTTGLVMPINGPRPYWSNKDASEWEIVLKSEIKNYRKNIKVFQK